MSGQAELLRASLPEQRVRFRVVFGGISTHHVVRDSTFPSAREPGRWTRRAWNSQALCGGLRRCVIGRDADEWPVASEPLDIERVTCARCRARYGRIAP